MNAIIAKYVAALEALQNLESFGIQEEQVFDYDTAVEIVEAKYPGRVFSVTPIGGWSVIRDDNLLDCLG
jgi:hypothetical protein